MKASESYFEPTDIAKFMRVMEALQERDIKVVDWDAKEIEVQFPDGTRHRWDKFWATSHIANELNKRLTDED